MTKRKGRTNFYDLLAAYGQVLGRQKIGTALGDLVAAYRRVQDRQPDWSDLG